MKFIFANNYLYLRGGSERVFFDEIEMLKFHNHEVIPFSRHFEKNISSHYMNYFASPLEYDNVSSFKKITAGIKLIYSTECRNKFSELITLCNPHIIHVHNIYGRLTTSILDVARGKNIPSVITLHDYKLICPSYLMLLHGKICEKCQGKRFYHCAIQRCHKSSLVPSLIYTAESYFNRWFNKYGPIKYFICPSIFLKGKLVQAGFPDDQLIHLPNFIKVEQFKPIFTPGEYILFVGRISKEKGIMTLLKAVKKLELKVKIVGDGPMRNHYEAFVKENNMKHVVFEGHKSGRELETLFQNAAILVIPSEWYEIFGLVIGEAFAYGKPVLGSHIGAIPELVIENKTGLLFDPKNHHELREKIDYLLSRPSLIIDLGRKAREMIEMEYNAEKHYERLMEIYQKACS